MRSLRSSHTQVLRHYLRTSKASLQARMDVEISLPEYTLARERRIVADAQLEAAKEGKLGIDAVVVPPVE